MKIIVGLGNPGKEYQNTRHNTGFMVMGRLAKIFNFQFSIFNENLKAEIGETEFKKEKIILVKPQTFMNESGMAVKKIVSGFKGLKVQDGVWVVHDDLDLPLARIKIVKNRGAAGHKGVESIIQALGTKDFVRFRIGTKEVKSSKLKVQSYEDYVLSEFKGEKKELWEKAIDRCAEAVIFALENGIKKAMNKYNQVIGK